MVEQSAATEVVRNDEQHRYEIRYGGELAGFTVYREQDAAVVFVHTEIGEAFGGKGLGGTLAKHAIEDVIARGRVIVAQCPFIAAFLGKHPEYDEHVAGKGVPR